ncbi:response regulator [candidate division KSB1 bacterium]|nr:response regulator [candidate division KSB1 bacterium]
MRSKRPILLVEDDQIDIMTVKRALKKINVANQVTSVVNGEDALHVLRDTEALKPAIILLDLNMPRMNGIEFLKIIKNDKNLCRIPVVVLTTSQEEQDKRWCFNLGVAGYMLKPVDYEEFIEIIRVIDLCWTLSELPEED